MTIGQGIYRDFPVADYHADPAPEPSLSQSIAKVLIERSPAHARIAHPRLNPDFEPDDPTKYDVGNIAHRLFLGRGKDLQIVMAEDWRTNAAKEARAAAAADGRLGVLKKVYERAVAIVDAATRQLTEIGWMEMFEAEHAAEVVAIANEDGTWLRTMIDWMPTPRLCVDVKTTGLSVAPANIPTVMANAGWPIQAAMQERILDALDPDGAGRRVFRFIAIEDDPPFALTPVELSEAAMTIGRKQVDFAVNRWRECMAAKQWPAYGGEVQRPAYPQWKEAAWLAREVEESERPRRGMIPSLMGG